MFCGAATEGFNKPEKKKYSSTVLALTNIAVTGRLAALSQARIVRGLSGLVLAELPQNGCWETLAEFGCEALDQRFAVVSSLWLFRNPHTLT